MILSDENHISLSIGEAAHICRVSAPSIRLWVKDKKIPLYTTPGRHWRFLVKDLVAFFSSHRRGIIPPDLQKLHDELLRKSQEKIGLKEELQEMYARQARSETPQSMQPGKNNQETISFDSIENLFNILDSK